MSGTKLTKGNSSIEVSSAQDYATFLYPFKEHFRCASTENAFDVSGDSQEQKYNKQYEKGSVSG